MFGFKKKNEGIGTVLNMPEIVREAKEEFYRVNTETQMARAGTEKHDKLMHTGVMSIIHEKYGEVGLKMYKDYFIKES